MIEAKSQDIKIVSVRTASGREVILSSQALEFYGEDYIDQLADRSQQNRLLLLDQYVYDDAKKQFPNSVTPLIDAYPDFLLDGKDVLSNLRGQGYDIPLQYDTVIGSFISTDREKEYSSSIKGGDYTAYSDPSTRNGVITIPKIIDVPDTSNVGEDQFKLSLLSSISGLPPGVLKNIPGTSEEWGKFLIDHEAEHIRLGHTDRSNKDKITDYGDLMGLKTNPSDESQREREKTLQEIGADVEALQPFNKASGRSAQFTETLRNMRQIGASLRPFTMENFSKGEFIDGHDSAGAIDNLLRSNNSTANPDRTQFTTAYTNTLARALITYTDGSESAVTPQKIYAANLALLQSGELDHAPDAKKEAQRFVDAIQHNAPSLMDTKLVDRYRDSIKKPETHQYLTGLHQYYQPDLRIGYLTNSQPAPPPPAPP